MNFILSLRILGLSIEEIKNYLSDNDSQTLNKELGALKQKVQSQIANLQQVLEVLNEGKPVLARPGLGLTRGIAVV